MPTIETPIDELGAVNLMLRSIGEAPINTLLSGTTVDVTLALQALRDTSEAVQAQAWKFNTERKYSLVPDNNGHITLPANILRVTRDDSESGSFDLVQRGTTLYDRLNHTDVFPKAIFVEVVFKLSFDQLPPVARRYIAVKAARIFQASVMGSDTLHGFTKEDEVESKMMFEEYEGEQSNHSIFSHYDIGRIMDRHSPDFHP